MPDISAGFPVYNGMFFIFEKRESSAEWRKPEKKNVTGDYTGKLPI